MFDPFFVSGSLDEASLVVTQYCRDNHVTARQVAEQIKQLIFERTSCTASVGIACNKSLAKICSNMNKPNGLVFVFEDVWLFCSQGCQV